MTIELAFNSIKLFVVLTRHGILARLYAMLSIIDKNAQGLIALPPRASCPFFEFGIESPTSSAAALSVLLS